MTMIHVFININELVFTLTFQSKKPPMEPGGNFSKYNEVTEEKFLRAEKW